MTRHQFDGVHKVSFEQCAKFLVLPEAIARNREPENDTVPAEGTVCREEGSRYEEDQGVSVTCCGLEICQKLRLYVEDCMGLVKYER